MTQTQKAIEKQQPSPITTLRQMLESKQMQLEIRKALPNGWSPEKFVRVAITAAQKNPRIAECTMMSVAGAIMECAQLGLETDQTLGHAYLVPFKNTKAGVSICTMIAGYRGYISLAMRAGGVGAIFAEVVREGELFAISYGTRRSITHGPKFPQSTDPRHWTGVYAVIEYLHGGRDWEYLEPRDVERCRMASRAKDDGPWVTHTEDMWKKSAIRKLAKRLDLSPEDKRLQRLAVLDEYKEAGIMEKTGLGIDDYQFTDQGREEIDLPGPVVTDEAPNAAGPQQPPADAHAKPSAAPTTAGKPGKARKSPANAKSESVAKQPQSTVKKADTPKPAPGSKITEEQRSELFRAADKVMDYDSVRPFIARIIGKHGFSRSTEVTVDAYDAILKEIEAGGYPDA